MEVLPDEGCTLAIRRIDHFFRMLLRNAIFAHAFDLEIARRIQKNMEGVFPPCEVVRSPAADDHTVALIGSFNENRARKFAHLLAIEMLTIDNTPLCAATPEQSTHASKERIGVFVELLYRFDVDIRHLGDVKNQRFVYELPVQSPGDLGGDLDSAASDFAINGDVANAHT